MRLTAKEEQAINSGNLQFFHATGEAESCPLSLQHRALCRNLRRCGMSYSEIHKRLNKHTKKTIGESTIYKYCKTDIVQVFYIPEFKTLDAMYNYTVKVLRSVPNAV